MLQLMPLLEQHGKKFADKSLISISGATACRRIELPCLFCKAHPGCWMCADAQDKALVFQADAETSLLGAIRQVTSLEPQHVFCTCNFIAIIAVQ